MSRKGFDLIYLYVTPAMAERLDTMKARSGYRYRGQLIRSLLLAIINDDAKAHGEKPLDETMPTGFALTKAESH